MRISGIITRFARLDGDPPPVPLIVTAFFWSVEFSRYFVTWNGPITYAGANTLGGVTVDGETAQFINQLAPDTLGLIFPTASGPGTAWAIDSQPPEISQPLDFPESGVTA